eukprot:SAG11_NODE_136_length_15118_cov_14.188495_16_plen_184_part_00
MCNYYSHGDSGCHALPAVIEINLICHAQHAALELEAEFVPLADDHLREQRASGSAQIARSDCRQATRSLTSRPGDQLLQSGCAGFTAFAEKADRCMPRLSDPVAGNTSNRKPAPPSPPKLRVRRFSTRAHCIEITQACSPVCRAVGDQSTGHICERSDPAVDGDATAVDGRYMRDHRTRLLPL